MTTVNALTRSKTASQALKSNDLRDVNPASISPLVPVAGIYLYCRRQTLQRPPPLPLHGRPIPLRSRVWHVMAPPSGLVENRCTSRTTQASPPFCSLLFCSSLIAHCSLPTGWSVYCCFICIGCMHRSLILVAHSSYPMPCTVLDRVLPSLPLALQCYLLIVTGLFTPH